MEIISKLEQEATERKFEALDKLRYDDSLLFLFDAAVLFEQRYAFLDSTSDLQTATAWLCTLIKEVFNKYHLKTSMHTEEAHLKIMHRLAHLKEKGVAKPLTDLWQCYEALEGLENLKQIHEYDGNCEVMEYEEGCIITRVREDRFEHFQSYIRDGLKYQALTEYYLNKGRYVAFELVRHKAVAVKGTNEDDQADSFDHICRQIATKEFLEHYGIEEDFTLDGKEYRSSLLIQILAFLSVYATSRYGQYWENSAGESDVINRIFGVWKSTIEIHGQMAPGPLYVDSWKNMVERLGKTVGKYSLEEIERHLAFFALELDASNANPNLIEKPLLRLGNLVIFFARPLMHQNSWLPILLPLIKATRNWQPKQAPDRIKASTENLAQKFEHHHFAVWRDFDLVDQETQNTITDIDIVALKDDCLVLVQVKMTYPRASLKEAWYHRNAMETAGVQMAKSITFLEEHWEIYRHKLGTGKEWSDFEIIPLVVSTSFEYDRELFSGFLKISQFELERYLENDAFLFHLGPDWPTEQNDWEKEHVFYPVGETLSGELLRTLIASNALWHFLEPVVLAKPMEGLLPEFCLEGSKAYTAQEYFLEGSANYQKNDFVQAEKMFREAIFHFSHYEIYHRELGSALAMQGKQLESLTYFDKAIQIAPCKGESYFARGVAFQELGMYDKAYQDYLQAIRFSPRFMPAWLNIVHLQVSRGQNLHFKQFLSEAQVLATKGLTIFAQLPDEEQERFGEVAIYLDAISRS